MLYLETLSPLTVANGVFPRRDGVPFLEAEYLREALLTAALSYAIGRDEAFGAEMRRLAQHGFKGDAAGLAEAMSAALLVRQPELAALQPPDVSLAEVTVERVVVCDLESVAAGEEKEVEVYFGSAQTPLLLPPQLSTWLAAATRGFGEQLLAAENRLAARCPSRNGEFYQRLPERLFGRATLPLRLGKWSSESQQGRFLAFEYDEAAGRALLRRFSAAPFPRSLLQQAGSGRSLGWAVLKEREP